MESDLPAILRHAEVKAMFDNATLIRNTPDSLDQAKEAERQIRMALYKFALGQITEQEKQQIIDLLHPCCPEVFFTPPSIDVHQTTFSTMEDATPPIEHFPINMDK